MKRAVLVVATLAAISSTASAGPYLGLGIGPSPAVHDDTDRLDSIGRSGKILGGYSFSSIGKFAGRISIEGSIGRNGMTLLDRGSGQDLPYGNLTQASLSGKLSFPLGDRFEAFGRIGVLHMSIDAAERPEENREMFKVAGNGPLLGGGFEYRLTPGFVSSASIFLDYTLAKAKLDNETSQSVKFDASTRIWTLGLTVGF